MRFPTHVEITKTRFFGRIGTSPGEAARIDAATGDPGLHRLEFYSVRSTDEMMRFVTRREFPSLHIVDLEATSFFGETLNCRGFLGKTQWFGRPPRPSARKNRPP